ncbi:acetolactate decarboxylase [Derxia lacustris]|uniref:acetolactate decarboxylase n=1 Tax=Derxia lacustris TaxID=764842 RepID=UPI000A17828F|nr:acetolactate decarboxylase [Derxia lacustris]
MKFHPAHALRALGLAAALALPALGAAQAAEPPAAVYAYSTIDALLAGAYDGDLTIAELLRHGDFGIGTFNRLDGELVLLDGRAYHVHADDSVELAPASDRTPLAYVLPFRPAASLALDNIASLRDLEALLDARLGNLNLFHAVRIDGAFVDVSTRAIAPQTRPYKPLAEIVPTQSVFRFAATDGVMVGIRSPGFTKGVSVPGWHWHYLTADRKRGGHVLTLGVAKAVAQLAPVDRLEVQLPATEDFARADQTRDRKDELKKVEGAR